MSGKQGKLWVVILAGGDGRRLGSLTTNADGVSTPKQYCSLNGGPSLLQLALRRALGLVPRERIVPVVTEAHRRWWEPELFALRRSSVVVQPSNRGTGLGVLVALLVIAKSDPEARLLCMPSDHYVENEDVLAEFLRQATAPDALDSNKLALLGMFPNAPDPGFGYLSSFPGSGIGMRPVQSFIEKPDRATAAQLIRAGSVWSSGIVAGRISEMVALYPRQIPGLMLHLKSIVEYWPDSRVPSAELMSLYGRHPILDFSRDILQEHPSHLQFLTVPPCGWSDVGTPARLAMTLSWQRSKTRRGISVTGPRIQSCARLRPSFDQWGSQPRDRLGNAVMMAACMRSPKELQLMTKAILLLDTDGLALAPATLCAETSEEARKRNLPRFDDVLSQLSAGKELRMNGSMGYQLFQAGQRVALLEVFDSPS